MKFKPDIGFEFIIAIDTKATHALILPFVELCTDSMSEGLTTDE